MSHYGREASITFSYVDGVPVKISEKFKPPRKVTLPVGFQHRLPTELVSEEYDFRLEHSVLKKMGEWRGLRRAAVDSRKERIKAHDTAWQEKLSEDVQKFSIASDGRKYETRSSDNSVAAGNSCPTVSSTTSHSLAFPNTISSSSVAFSKSSLNTTSSDSFSGNVSSVSLNVDSTSTVTTQQGVQYSHRTSILTPVPISQMTSNINSTKSSSQFNISDFEADTSSPFDNMELKTINEMEELAHVLQPASNSPDNNKNNALRSDVNIANNFSSHSSSYGQTIVHYNTIGSKPTKESVILPHMNGLTGYSPGYSTGPRLKERDTRNENYVSSGTNLFDHVSSVQQELGNMYGYYPHQAWNVNINVNHPDAYHTAGNGDIKANVTANISSGDNVQPVEALAFTTADTKPLTTGISFPSTYHQHSTNDGQQSPVRSLSKSVPDIVQELEKELAEKRDAERSTVASRTSHTPPPRPNSLSSAGLEDWKPWPELDSPEQSQVRGKKPLSQQIAKKSSLQNPFHELSPNSQKLVKHISEMGFQLPRVARACKMLGDDDKKVVEFLLHVQSLEEMNWPGDAAEKALIINDCNTQEAKRYLEALTQLLDLGFPEDKVSEALGRFHNDRDKALDYLIS